MERPLLLEVPQLSNACRRRVEMSGDGWRLAYGPCTRSEGGDRRASIRRCGSAALIDFPGLGHPKRRPRQASDGRAPDPGSALPA